MAGLDVLGLRQPKIEIVDGETLQSSRGDKIVTAGPLAHAANQHCWWAHRTRTWDPLIKRLVVLGAKTRIANVPPPSIGRLR